jgi:hypothetical protein
LLLLLLLLLRAAAGHVGAACELPHLPAKRTAK